MVPYQELMRLPSTSSAPDSIDLYRTFQPVFAKENILTFFVRLGFDLAFSICIG